MLVEEQEQRKEQLDRSELVEEILGTVPSAFIRGGSTFFLIFIGLLLFLTYLIKYPDIMLSRIVITTPSPPVRVMARANGRISDLKVTNSQAVQQGDVLAVLENTANEEDILILENYLRAIQTVERPEGLSAVSIPQKLKLGRLQNQYASFSQNTKDILYFFKTRQNLDGNIQSIQQQITHYQELNISLKTQEDVLAQEVSLAKEDYERNKKLFASGVTSQLSLEKSEAFYLQYKRQKDALKSQLINNNILVERLKSQINQMGYDRNDREVDKFLTIKENIQSLQSAIELWKQTYLIRAPISGTISMTSFWNENQYVTTGEEVLSVIPEASENVFGKVAMPEQNSGKVEIGQNVIIKLDGYPFREFGTIKGRVRRVSKVARNNLFYVDVELPEGLQSTHKKRIAFVQEMQGTAEIVTEDLRLMERIFYQIRAAFAP